MLWNTEREREAPAGMSLHTYLSRKAATSHSGKIVSPERERNEKKKVATRINTTLPLPLHLHENDTSYIVREELERGC